jgi:hypothetical protein
MYDLRTLTPGKEFQELYERMRREMEDLGIVFRS